MHFELKVVKKGMIKDMMIESLNPEQARQEAERQGWNVLTIENKSRQSLHEIFKQTRAQSFNLMLFSQELLALLASGLSLIEAIEALAEKEQNVFAQSVFKQILQGLFDGLPLSAALALMPAVFPPLYVALIQSSETTGDMPQALLRHVTYQTQIEAVRKKIITASIYPVLLIVVGGLVVLFLLGYVVPKFSTIYESTGADLPWMSQLLLSWGKLVQSQGQIVGLTLLGFITSLGILFSRPSVRAFFIAWFWKIPTFGEMLRTYQLARFHRTLGMLLRGGIPLVTAMTMVSSLLQSHLRQQLDLVIHAVREGQPLSVAMEQYGMTTAISIRMLRVAERTGQMGDMMERIGAFYDDEIERAVEWLTKLLEPVLMIVIGLIVGLVVVLMYMPIFELAGSIE